MPRSNRRAAKPMWYGMRRERSEVRRFGELGGEHVNGHCTPRLPG